MHSACGLLDTLTQKIVAILTVKPECKKQNSYKLTHERDPSGKKYLWTKSYFSSHAVILHMFHSEEL